MNDIEELVKLLDHPDDNYWGDILCDDARAVIDHNPEMILGEVLQTWEEWPENRLEHLAYLLGEGLSEVEKDLIEALHKSKYQSVTFRAKEAVIELESTHSQSMHRSTKDAPAD
ncbi:hypothetical protein KCM76_04870 [Zooshikella marina]|uniref:hypothetical protein n=1 Tax=Zooshikella ganghwensis TaxID=202772 RepID=UPI001BAF3644|nr:hypothetical protein [Zooshikella ganghwensis]MBU2705300.1 hypothetical protein [Zooshikella ganghwensis]